MEWTRSGDRRVRSRASERIIVEVMGDEPLGHRWRPATALAVLVAVTATVGVVIAIFATSPDPRADTTDADSNAVPVPDANRYPGPARPERNVGGIVHRPAQRLLFPHVDADR
jgi:hypothetical protein